MFSYDMSETKNIPKTFQTATDTHVIAFLFQHMQRSKEGNGPYFMSSLV